MNGINSDNLEVFSFSTDRIEFKSEDGEDYVIGYVSTHDRDIVDDIVTKSCMMDMLSQYKSGKLKLDLEHETLKGINSFDKKMNITKVPLAVSVDALYDGKGLIVKYKMNKKYKKLDSKGDVVYDYEDVKTMVKSGDLDAFSIAYITEETAEKKCDDGVTARLLEKIKCINTALTGNPVNRGARMVDIMMKSLDSAETKSMCEYSSFNDCVSKNKDKKDPEAYCAAIRKKIEGKTMNDDGLHFHTQNEPQGAHNHPEVEMRLNDIWKAIWDIQEKVFPKPESKGGNVMEENKQEKKSEEATVQKNEEKFDMKAFTDKFDGMVTEIASIKSAVEEQKKAFDGLKKEMEIVKADADKPVFSAKSGETANISELAKKKAIEDTDPLSFV